MARVAPMAERKELARSEAQRYVASFDEPSNQSANASYRSALDYVVALKKRVQAIARAVTLSKPSVDPLTKKEKTSYQVVAERRALRRTCRKLKSAKQVYLDLTA